ncbi:Uncharacterized conserved protein, DUF302 family [Rhizobiales bacterium GAS191]|jgi:uncharacterized protein (DUF302 family)|nr:Uncharacterized conserved protein, DUF302 family [Rhizobiales bacterium GAS113]SEC54820.1 Uncharacterized conserved protein, DUF302 family [Rhizobiales bacterium GAS188]SEC73194.1 Uncharacterized conserved protein, DUF302 family [Rhizobiales bacterium GAS191]
MTLQENGTAIAYAAPGEAAGAFQRARSCDLTVEDAVARLRNAIIADDLWVLHEIDPQAVLRRAGYAIAAARQILFFHPRFMARILAADPAALLEAPLKFAILELPGGGVSLRWLDPAVAFGRYRSPALDILGQELAAICERIVGVALDPSVAAARM